MTPEELQHWTKQAEFNLRQSMVNEDLVLKIVALNTMLRQLQDRIDTHEEYIDLLSKKGLL